MARGTIPLVPSVETVLGVASGRGRSMMSVRTGPHRPRVSAEVKPRRL